MRFEQVLPDRDRLRCEEIRITDELITVVVASSSPAACCPSCDQPSARIHSRYVRTLTDLPWHGSKVRLIWNTRKFRCQNTACARRIFTERLPEVAAPNSRKTRRLETILAYLGFACGGEGGSRLADRLGMPSSPDTLLRKIRQHSTPEFPTPRVLGVDDWAFRRGQRYGTILCDLERHRPVALLPDRSAECFTAWLQQHPGVEIISRDRGDPYIKGATAGAPEAIQVADRFHLVRNLRDALCRWIDGQSTHVLATVRFLNSRKRSPTSEPALPLIDEQCDQVVRVTAAEQSVQKNRTRRIQVYEQVVDLYHQQVSKREIARRLGLDRGTVQHYLRAGTFPERAPRIYRRRIDPFREHLLQRWQSGCTNAHQLFRELQTLGFTGSYWCVRRHLANWRLGPKPQTVSHLSIRKPSSRCIAIWLLKPREKRSEEEQTFLSALEERCSSVPLAAEMCREFETLLRNHHSDQLDGWLEKVTNGPIPELRRFAVGVRDDLAAVRAAFSLPWNNGQVEGQVHRLKLIKRQMYGRANFDLLQGRVLFAG